jgi:putative transposase
MAQTTFRLARGDTVALPDGIAGRQLWRVERRLRTGYLTSSLHGAANRVWTHDEIRSAWVDHRMEHWPVDLSGLDEALALMLQSDLDRWPPEKIFEARCREAYVQRVDELRREGLGKYKAYRRAAVEITAEHGEAWSKRRAELAAQAEARAPRRRKVRSIALAEAPVSPLALGGSAVKKWWLRWDKAGRDLRALIAQDHLRGDHSPRFEDRRGEQKDDADVRCVYGAMAWLARTVYMGQTDQEGVQNASVPTVTSTKKYAHERLGEKLEELGLPSVSITTFSKFLRDRYDAYDEFRARFGPKAAYLKFHIFERRALPDRAMEEVEVDHCLLDVFVIDRHGRIARPWLTVLICRATKMIVGMHIGFDPPSSETLARAVLHAILPKVLDGTGVENDWPCMGGFDMLITDRGLELMSEAFQRAGNRLKFAIVNLPGRSPWLKATVERFFGTLGVRVLSRLEGTTRARAPEWYDPQARARFGLAELTGLIVRWIVDDYHEADHKTLGTSPRRRWKELAEDALDGGVRVPPPFKDVFRMLGEGGITRVIGNNGISFDNNHYSSPDLERFRRTHGGRKPVEIIAEYFDRSFIWVKLGDDWKEVPATGNTLLKGRSRYANRIINRLARKLTPKGQEVTEDTLERARLQCEEEARTLRGRRAMRFGSEGALATDVVGNNGRLAVLANGLEVPAGAGGDGQDSDEVDAVAHVEAHAEQSAHKADEVGEIVVPIAAPAEGPADHSTDQMDVEAPPPMQDLQAILAGLAGAERMLR